MSSPAEWHDATQVLPRVPSAPPRRPRRRLPWPAVVAIVLVLVFPVLLVGLLWARVHKVSALVADPAARSDGTVYLLVGSDSRAGLSRTEQNRLNTGRTPGQRTDTILLLSVPGAGQRPALVSVPRDSLVDIPGHGRGRINAAFAYGGPRLLVRTLQEATGVQIDEYVEIGFGGFVGVVDAVGGVQVCLKSAFADKRTELDLSAGCHDLDATQALAFVRARYGDPRADLGRVERQRQFLGALSDRITSPLVLLDPWRLLRLTWATGDAVRVDRSTYPWDLARFALGMRAVSGSGSDRLTVPLGRTGNTVDWDPQRAGQLWAALRDGRSVPRTLVG